MEREIREAIQTVLKDFNLEGIVFSVEHPNDVTHGDYATNVAMVCAKELGQNPRQTAEQFHTALEGKIKHVASIEIAGPGFINFRLTRDFFSEKITEAISAGDSFGRNEILQGEEILFEYTSPNLMKPLHVGNLVGNIVGESVSRIFEFAGATVRRINYPSDIGLTVAKGVWGLRANKADPEDINQIGEAYRAGNEAYEGNSEAKEEIEAINRALYAGTDSELNKLRDAGLSTSHRHLTELCRMLGTTFDAEIRESEASGIGTDIVREHVPVVFEESEGAIIFPGEKYGLHTRVFINSQGLPTYEAKDIGNFALKEKKYPSWTQSFIVTGGEQREYFKVLTEAIRKIFTGADRKIIEHIGTGFLTLTTGKMSSRKGNVLTGESILSGLNSEARKRAEESRAEDVSELTESVSVGALKYQILRQGVGQDIVFDKERALSLEGDSGPYLQYTHARMTSVIVKADEAGVQSGSTLSSSVPYDIEKIVYRFPEVVTGVQKERAPHHLVVYLTELASAFNAFYAQEKIADTTDQYAPYKLLITKASLITMKNGLYLLGIKAPDAM